MFISLLPHGDLDPVSARRHALLIIYGAAAAVGMAGAALFAWPL